MADKPKHRHTGHRERMKAEFLARGLEGWPDHRVLELLLFYTIPQGDVNDLAHELVERFGSLAGVLDASVEELKKVKGVGDHTAVFLRMLPAVLGRYQGARTRLSAIINSPEEAYAWLEPYFFGARNEMVYVLCLDGKRQVLGVRIFFGLPQDNAAKEDPAWQQAMLRLEAAAAGREPYRQMAFFHHVLLRPRQSPPLSHKTLG